MADRITSALTPEHLDTLDGLVTEMAARRERDETFVDVDRDFHALLVHAIGNELIGQLSGAFWDVYHLITPQHRSIPEADETDIVEVHRNMVLAARSGDATAFSLAVTEHYAPARSRMQIAKARLAG
jgi:DNA-binding FadR family transcriptional regulator